MRWFTLLIMLIPAVVLPFYNHSINERARLIKTDIESTRIAIRSSSEELQRLNAEWAHLTNPDRIACLADFYLAELELVPATKDVYGSLAEIPRFNDVPVPVEAMIASLEDVEVRPVYYAPLTRDDVRGGALTPTRTRRSPLVNPCR